MLNPQLKEYGWRTPHPLLTVSKPIHRGHKGLLTVSKGYREPGFARGLLTVSKPLAPKAQKKNFFAPKAQMFFGAC